MIHGDPPFQLLYLSRLAPDRKVAVIAEILSISRQRNAELGITGALLFDGERFCQLLEGEEIRVAWLMQRIESDRRHTRIEVLFAGRSDRRTFKRWTAGYCEASTLDAFEGRNGRQHASAVDAFVTIARDADLD